MNHSLKLFRGVMSGVLQGTIGVIEWDTRGLDYSSYQPTDDGFQHCTPALRCLEGMWGGRFYG